MQVRRPNLEQEYHRLKALHPEWRDEKIMNTAKTNVTGPRQKPLIGFEKPKRTNKKLMHAVDAGTFPDGRDCAHFICSRCGHDDGWSGVTMTVAKRGIPCPKCNGEKA